ncbi:MAG: 4-hydroxythreonine-4-phosphate dehydrogenase PdxA [Phycisphaerales bacterium]|nr:4-hydroxythreonine-4-phosphate dehydrogenase PdxA [Phycisphaerales bacterium]
MPSEFANSDRPVIAISMGDPAGIGAEVIVKALAGPNAQSNLRSLARFRILGSAGTLDRAAANAGITPFWRVVDHDRLGDANVLNPPSGDSSAEGDVLVIDRHGSHEVSMGKVSAAAGHLSFHFVDDAIAMALRPAGDPWRADAIVTGPISKEAWKRAGHGRYPGHTELLAERCGIPSAAMLFHAPAESGAGRRELNVVLVTIHVPLMRVAGLLSPDRIARVIEQGAAAVREFGHDSPRVGVCGLNPHAGEHGLMGDEDDRVIVPAIELARSRGINAEGPFPADTIYNAALRGRFDLIVAMYHDQGLIPIKVLAWDCAVNVTLGLPIIRTSPDHGTAFDIADQNMADAESMTSAIELAVRLAKRKAATAR